MKISKPSKVTGIAKIFLFFYSYGLVGSIPLAALIRYEDTHRTSPLKFSPPDWFYATFAFGMPIIASIVIFLIFLMNTRRRKLDPYRFEAKQSRFLRVRLSDFPDFRELLGNLGYANLVEVIEEGKISIEAARVSVPQSSRLSQKQFPTPHVLSIQGVREEGEWKIRVDCRPANSIVPMDEKSTIFDSLEELVEMPGLREARCDWNWINVDENWLIQ